MCWERSFKWGVCGLLFLAVTILYADRQALAIVAPQLTSVFDWSETDYGNMISAYQLAYAVGVFGVGFLTDRLGTRLALGLFVLFWSLATLAHGWAASVPAFIAARFALGLAQSGCFPCAIKATAEWFPKEERALATGLFNCGSMLGPILAPITILFLYTRHGWLTTCAVLGAAGTVWALVWLAFYRMPSAPAPRLGTTTGAETEKPIPVTELLRCRATWAFFFGKLLSDPVWWFFLYWLPKFLHGRHGLALDQLGAPLVTIYTITILGSVGAGWLTHALSRRGMAVRSARKTVMLLCALLPIPVLMAARTPHVWLAVLLIGLAMAGHSGWMANLFSLVSDAFPKGAVASVTGIGTMAGALGGIFVAQLTGWVLDATGSYWPLFAGAAFAYVTAWLLIQLLLPTRRRTA